MEYFSAEFAKCSTIEATGKNTEHNPLHKPHELGKILSGIVEVYKIQYEIELDIRTLPVNLHWYTSKTFHDFLPEA